jgi:hypothetical protein
MTTLVLASRALDDEAMPGVPVGPIAAAMDW